MKKILITGSLGQIGSELTLKLRKEYGISNVISTDIKSVDNEITGDGIFHILDVLDEKIIRRFYYKKYTAKS